MHYFNLHTHQSVEDGSVLELVNQYPDDFDATADVFSIGIHPWHIKEDAIEAEMDVIASAIQQPNCLAIGECGLDKRIEMPLDLQRSVFEKQLLLAEEHRKPVIIHCVAAFQELIAVKNRLDISVPMVIHGFSKGTELAKQLLREGFYLSFGKYLLQNPDLETVLQSVPDDRFFLETDSSAESIVSVYELAAKYKNITLAELQNTIKHNFKTVFKNGRMD